MDLRALLTVAKRWAWLLVGSTLIAGASALAIQTILAPPATYRAEAVALVGPALSANAFPGELDAARRVAQIYATVATSGAVLDRVAEDLGGGLTAEELAAAVTVTTPQEPPILTIAAVTTEPDLAVDIANRVLARLAEIAPTLENAQGEGQEFIRRQASAIQQEIETLIPEIESLSARPNRTGVEEQRLEFLQNRLTNLRGTYAQLVNAATPAGSNLLTILDEAESAVLVPSGRLFTTLLGGLFGLALAVAVLILIEKLDDTLRSAEHARRSTGFRDLGELLRIPRAASRQRESIAMVVAPQSEFSESIRTVRVNIEFAAPEPLRTLVVTSAQRRDGRTMVAVNLAVAFARAGREVLLVDMDMRRPAVHRYFRLPNHHGMSDLVLSHEAPIGPHIYTTQVPGLSILPAGVPPPATTELAGLTEIVHRIASRSSGLVIFDTGPVIGSPETAVLASTTDATVLVVAAGRTSIGALEAARDSLVRARARVIGTVMNHVPRLRTWRYTTANTESAETSQPPARSLTEDRSNS
jgi:capsular exopolysaccharide synthesis family protein